MSAGQTILLDAMKNLRVHWDRTKADWDDPVSRELERRYLEPLEARVRNVLNAMDHVEESARRAKRDCGGR